MARPKTYSKYNAGGASTIAAARVFTDGPGRLTPALSGRALPHEGAPACACEANAHASAEPLPYHGPLQRVVRRLMAADIPFRPNQNPRTSECPLVRGQHRTGQRKTSAR